MPSIVLKVVERRPSSSVDCDVDRGGDGGDRVRQVAVGHLAHGDRQVVEAVLVEARHAVARAHGPGGRTERVTQTASPIAIRIATIATMSIRRDAAGVRGVRVLDGARGGGGRGGGELRGRGLHLVVQREQLALVHACGTGCGPRRCVTVSLREASSACFCSSSISARMAAQAVNSSSTGVPLKSCSSLAPSALLVAQLPSISSKCSSCCGEVAVVDVKMQADEAHVVLGALLHAAEQLQRRRVGARRGRRRLVAEAGQGGACPRRRQSPTPGTEHRTRHRGARREADCGSRSCHFCRPAYNLS